ncbi:hypothetical protein MHU86_24138 [Fragilaria crotonensis]|nr:hypothetical protein MHU86_24138 [Fragilaria crotonensis]
MNAMSSGYDPVVVKFRGELAETSLTKLRKEIVLQYKSLVKVKGKSTSESALLANANKHPFKKFKGTCRNCGKIGHKAADCTSKATEGNGASGKGKGTADKSHVTCYNCGEKGTILTSVLNPRRIKSRVKKLQLIWLCLWASLASLRRSATTMAVRRRGTATGPTIGTILSF